MYYTSSKIIIIIIIIVIIIIIIIIIIITIIWVAKAFFTVHIIWSLWQMNLNLEQELFIWTPFFCIDIDTSGHVLHFI